jgi:hypothetical protein
MKIILTEKDTSIKEYQNQEYEVDDYLNSQDGYGDQFNLIAVLVLQKAVKVFRNELLKIITF